MNYLDQLRGTVEEHFPKDEFFLNLYYDLRPGCALIECAFSEEELKETRKLIEQLLNNRLDKCQIEPKQAHPLNVLCAAWNQSEEIVREILSKSSYNQAYLEEIVVLVYVYQKKWHSISEVLDFVEEGVSEQFFWKIAFAAGAGANFDLIRQLRQRDTYLMYYVQQGMDTYGSQSNKDALKIMLSPDTKEALFCYRDWILLFVFFFLLL